MINLNFQNISIEDLMKGYQLQDLHYQCIHCEQTFFVHEVYPTDNKLLTAEGMVQLHIEQEHGSPFHALLRLDKKISGLSEVQQEMLKLFYEGVTDKDIVEQSSVNSISTVRQHRFKLREKERQAKIFLALMQLVSEPSQYKIHKGAKQVDERYGIRKKNVKKYYKRTLKMD